jgi:hypothetical protein
MSEIYRDYFLQQSPEFYANEHVVEVPFDLSQLPAKLVSLSEDESHFSQRWSLEKEADHYELEFKIWSPSHRSRCESKGPYTASDSCFRTVAVQVPLEVFSTEPSVRIAQTDAEAQALTRWANSNVTIHASDARELEHTNQKPFSLKWLSY